MGKASKETQAWNFSFLNICTCVDDDDDDDAKEKYADDEDVQRKCAFP